MDPRIYRTRWAWLALVTLFLALVGAWLSADAAFARSANADAKHAKGTPGKL